MNEKMLESLSALMDGEANELELERVLSKLGDDPELRQSWVRYNCARDAVQGGKVALLDRDISARVQAALAATPSAEPANSGERLMQRLWRPMVSVGVAASVALTVVIGGQQLAGINGTADQPGSNASVATSASPVGLLNSFGASAQQASFGTQSVPVLQPVTRTAYEDLAQQRMRRYMQEHAEQAALNTPQGLVPFARVPEIRE